MERWKKEDLWNKNHMSLGELVHRMVQNHQTETPEFQALIRGFGESKIREVLRIYREKKNGSGRSGITETTQEPEKL